MPKKSVNVKAVGDGSTDDTGAIQAAIDIAHSDNVRVAGLTFVDKQQERRAREASLRPVLSLGSRGPHVTYLQQRLSHTTEGGDFDEATEAAVRGFQAGRGLPVTGVVDAATWLALLSAQ
jgi:peptidoglycan hydrolase-like protein with peptidoglycan-binding domain